MGCCLSTKRLNWSQIDKLHIKPQLNQKEKKQVRQVFKVLDGKKRVDELAIATFECFFRHFPKAIDYFYHVVIPDDKALSLGGHKSLVNVFGEDSKKIEQTLGNARFVGHAKKVISETLVHLKDSLDDEPEFDKTCYDVMVFHQQLLGMNRIFFKKMFECLDDCFMKEVGALKYKGANQKAMHGFLTLIYFQTGKNLPEGEIDWLAVEEHGRLKSKYANQSQSEASQDGFMKRAYRKSLGRIFTSTTNE